MKTQALNVLALALGMAIASNPAQAQFQKRSDLALEQVALLENGNWLGTGDTGVYLSADQGVTWTKAAFPSQGRPGLGIATRSVVGGGLTFVGAIDDGIWLSRDHGTNWTFTGPVASSFGTGIGRMAYNGADYVAGYGGWPRGLYRWNGTRWDNTLAGTDGLSVLAAGNGRFLAGMLGGGVVSSDDGGRTWRNRHPEFQLLARTANTVLGVGTPSGVVRRSDDNGDTWREEGSAVPAASMGYVDQPAVYGGALYVPVHGSGIWLRRPDLTWTRVLTNSGFCSVHVVGPSLVVASQEGVFQMTDESAFARILAQPQSLTANLGDTATFSIVATNATTFQWLKDGTPLPGATNATLTLTNVQPPRIGDYQVVAGNGFGSVTSSVATLSINGVNPGIWKGLVAYYPFNGSPEDESGMGNHGVLMEGARWSNDGVEGSGSVEIDGINGLNKGVRVPRPVLNSGQDQYTINIWFKSTQPGKSPSQTLINTDPHHGFGITYNYDGTRRISMLLGSGWAWLTPMVYSTNAFPETAWRMASLVKQGARFGLYVNGRMEASLDAPVTGWNQPLSLWIGSIGPVFPGALWPGEVFAGLLDDCRIYNRALSSAELAALYASHSAINVITQPQSILANAGDTVPLSIVATNATTFQWFKDGTPLPGATNATLTLAKVQPPRIGDYQVVAGNGFGSVTSSVATLSINGVDSGIWKGLVRFYPLDGNTLDYSAVGANGISRALTYGRDRFGNENCVGSFNGSNSRVLIGDQGILNTHILTATVWVRIGQNNGSDNAILSKYFAASVNGWGLFANGKKLKAWYFGRTGTVYQPNEAEVFASLDESWNHVAVRFDGAGGSFFVNGKLMKHVPWTGMPSDSTSSQEISIGETLYVGSQFHQNFGGSLDDVRIYNRALSDSEIAALYSSELPPAAGIVSSPVSVTALVGGTATLSVGAKNALGYQWFKDGRVLSRATNDILVLANLRLADAGSYWVVAGNVMSRATSAPAAVVVQMPPAMVSEPLDTSVAAGENVLLKASVVSFPAATLQWLRDEVPIPGANSEKLVLDGVSPAGMGSYRLVASNVVGTISSRVARVTVTGADPAIWGGLVAYLPFNGGVADEGAWNHPVVQQGASLATDRRGKANAALALNGAGDFVEIPDHPAFATTNFTVALWFNPVRRAGASGGVDSETLFSKGPGSMDLQLGTSPSGTGGIRFRPRGEGAWDTTGPAFGTNRWQHVVAVYDASGGAVQVFVDGVARPMASSGDVVPSLTTTTNGLRLGLRHDGLGGFLGRLDDVRVYARALGASEVRALLASEAAAPVIVDQPQDVRRVEGSRVTVSAGLVGERPMGFAWSQAGATRVVTGESLEFASLGRQDAGLYKLVVTNVHGTATSRAFTVDVLYGPELVFEPTDTSVNAGATVRLGAGVDGNPAPTLQWTRDGRALPGATNSTLTLAGIQVGDAGVYRLVASNEVGTVTGREVRGVGVLRADDHGPAPGVDGGSWEGV